jgi:hypothetical protein
MVSFERTAVVRRRAATAGEIRMSARKPCLAVSWIVVLSLSACASPGASPGPQAAAAGSRDRPGPTAPMTGRVRIGYLHHSTGWNVWKGGVPEAIDAWNREHRTDYRIGKVTYPDTHRNGARSYPWANYPYDYWNLWVRNQGANRDRGEQNLDDLARAYDVIVWKHCFPVSGIAPDRGQPDVGSEEKTVENYRAQYAALKARMRQFPRTRFLVWTGAALTRLETTPEEAQRARAFFAWVKGTWDEPGDNIYVWDFQALETQGGLYLVDPYSAGSTDSHPNEALSRIAGPLVARRIIDVIEGRGDSGPITGQD